MLQAFHGWNRASIMREDIFLKPLYVTLILVQLEHLPEVDCCWYARNQNLIQEKKG